MDFRFRTVYRLLGLQSLPSDPWTVVAAVPLASLDPGYSQWLHSMGLIEMSVTALLSNQDVIFEEVDARVAIANSRLNQLVGHEAVATLESIAAIRAERAAEGSGPWLVVDVTGNNTKFTLDGSADLDLNMAVSHHWNQVATALNALDHPSVTDLHYRILGALRLAAGHPVHAVLSTKGSWYVRPDGRPHFEMSLSMSAKGFVSTPLRDDADAKLEGLLAASGRNPRVALALTAYGRSLDEGVDETLGFLAAFTALELLVKEEQRQRVRKSSPPKEGLVDWFRATAGDDTDDCAKFTDLYRKRNGVAHRARFDVAAGQEARGLFEKYMMASPLLGPE